MKPPFWIFRGHLGYDGGKLGWNVYADELGDPGRGVAFVNLSLEADPFDGNAWQDAVRVYAHGLGIDID